MSNTWMSELELDVLYDLKHIKKLLCNLQTSE